MALNFNLLDTNLPGQIAGSFQQGYQGAQDRANLLAQRQQQNQLSALQLQGVQQEQQQRNALNRGYSEAYNPQTGGIDYNKLRQSLAASGMGSQIPSVEKQQLEQQQTEAGLFSSKMDLFKNAWSNVRTLDDALAVHEKTHNDPIVGRMLDSMGITKEQGTQRLIEAAKNPETWTNYVRQAINGADAFKQQVVGGSIYDFATGQFKTPPREQQQPPGVQEYQFAKTPEGGGYKGSYQQFLADKSAAGRAPTGGGRAAAPATETGAPAPKPMTELQQRKVKQEQVQDFQSVRAAETVANELEKVTDELVGNPNKGIPQHPGYSRIVGFGAVTPTLPGGDAARAEQKLESFKGKIATFGRQLATEFGKLGNMAVAEWKIISDSVENINPRAGNLDEQMRNVVRLARDFEARQQEKYDALHGNENNQPAAPAKPITKGSRTVTKTGTFNGKRVVQYSDGSVEYAD